MEPVTVQVPRMTPQETTVGSSDYHRDGCHPGPQASRAGGANPLSTNDKLPAIPNCVTTNDHASCSTSDYLLCSTNYLCSASHHLRSTNYLWRVHWRKHHWRRHHRRKHHRRRIRWPHLLDVYDYRVPSSQADAFCLENALDE